MGDLRCLRAALDPRPAGEWDRAERDREGVGRLATTSNQNGTSTAYTWDGFARIQEIDHQLPTAQTFHKFEYVYDKVHNRRMEKNTFDAAWIATLPAQVQTFLSGRNGKGDVYAYDWAYRLVDARYDVTNPLQEVQNPGSQPFVKNVAYTLDGLGNRSQVLTTPPTPPSTVTYAADVVNQYTAVGGVARTHDNNGNLKDDGTYVFSYDFENRLVQVRQSGTLTLIADYHYDALGRRVEKVLAAGTTTRYLLDGVEVVEEYDAVGNWQARYVYEDGIDRPRCMDRADIADVNGNQNTTEVLRFHYHQQALGSVTEVTQPTGAVVEWVTYDVYGQPTIRDQQGNGITQSAIGNPYLFTGRKYDSEDGLYFYRARAYDPRTGRFLQRDPLHYTDSLTLYAYVGASPTCWVDPLGLSKGMPKRPKSGSTVYGTRSELIGEKQEDGSYSGGYVDELVENGVLSETEAQAVRDRLGNPHPDHPDQYPAGTAVARIAAKPTACERGDGQSLDVTYAYVVSFSLIFVVLEQGEKDPDPGTIAHEQGHVDIATAAAKAATPTTANEPQSTSKGRKKREKEIKSGKAPAVTDADNPPPRVTRRSRT